MFKTLIFPNIDDSTFRNCLGVLGFVMLMRRNKNYYTFVPAKFIQPLSKKANGNLIQYLIRNEYVVKVKKYESKEDHMFNSYYNARGYKKDPHIYLLLQKLVDLPVRYLNDRYVEKVVVTNLHFINFQTFNHWAHNYRLISINVPNNEIWYQSIDNYYYRQRINPSRPIALYIDNLKIQANRYGNHRLREYDISLTGIENHWGRVSNIFTTCEPILRKYTSLVNAVEIGIKYSEGVIMADQLLKKFGKNEFTDFFIDRAAAYREKLEEYKRKKIKSKKIKAPNPINKTLFELPNEDYYRDINQYFIKIEKDIINKTQKEKKKKKTSTEFTTIPLFKTPEETKIIEESELLQSILKNSPAKIGTESEPPKDIMRLLTDRHKDDGNFYRIEMAKALFGYNYNAFFHKFFPKTWSDILYHIKAGNGHYFKTFVSDINPTITKKDWRIQIKKGENFIHPTGQEIFERGQIYFKVVALVWILRENEIMRAIWKKLKNIGILCIPLNDKVLVAGRFEDAVTKITLDTWREYLDPKIKIFPEVIKRY